MTQGRQRGPELDRLEQDIHTLRIDFDRFLSGDLDLPPDKFRDAIRSQITALQGAAKAPVDAFRLGALEARFHSYSELFNRRLRARELQHGIPRRTLTRPASDPNQGIVLGQNLDADGVAPLYRHLYPNQTAGAMDLGTFTDYLARQHQLIRERTGCSQVSFRIVEENGKKKLKAKPVREATTA
jgi:hypothetical protein